MRILTVCAITMGASLMTLPTFANADPLWPVDQTFSASLGIFFLDNETTVRLDANNSDLGTVINLQDEFGFDDRDRFRIDGSWRFAKRHKVRFMYFDSSSDSSTNIHRDIHFGDETFPVDAFVRADLDIQIFEVAYEYAFLRRDTYEVSASIGLHNLSVKTRLRAGASSNAGAGGVDQESSADGDGPLPVLGLRGIWALSDHFYFDLQAQFFALEFDDFDGSLHDYKIAFNWQPLRNFGVGIGYNDFEARLDVTKPRFTGRLEFKYDGPLVFVTGAF